MDPDVVSFMLDAILDRFLQARRIEHLDAGLGLYRIDDVGARYWITNIVRLVNNGITDNGCDGWR